MPNASNFNYLSMLVPCLVAFLLCLCLFPPYIHWLKKQELGQYIRPEGPQSHNSKAGTPTAGGVCFIVSALVAVLLWFAGQSASAATLAVVFAALLAAAIGLVDDVAKLHRQANAGISAPLRLLLETLLGILFGWLLIYCNDTGIAAGGVKCFSAAAGEHIWKLPVPVFLAACAFYMAATTNALNLHDGMDGLAAGTSFAVLACLTFMLGSTGQAQLAAVSSAGAGAAAGFLIFNRPKASIFMGDTGSLFLGGLMAALVLAGRLEIWFVPLALIYIVETLSVIMQVVYFKLTKDYRADKPVPAFLLIWLKLTKRLPGQGKRLFRMAPLHHHFEAVGTDRGCPEWQIVACFWAAQVLICLLVLFLFMQT